MPDLTMTIVNVRYAPIRRLTAACAVILLTLSPALAQAPASKSDKPPSIQEQLPSLHLLRGPWDGGTVHRESLFFVKPADGKPVARLLFDAEKVMAVHRADGKQTFEAGKDYQLSDDGSSLLLPEESRIPFRKESELFVPKGSPNSIGHKTGQPNVSLLFGEGHFFHDQQVEVTYVPRKESGGPGTGQSSRKRLSEPSPASATRSL